MIMELVLHVHSPQRRKRMFSHRVVLTLFSIVAAMALLVIVTQASPASGEGSSANYNFLVASGFLCDPNNSTTCPAVARAANGDTIELSGVGMLSLGNKSVTAAGAFTQKSSTGAVIATGIWIATELLSFKSYRIAPGALMRQQPHKFKMPGFSPLGFGMLDQPMPVGGLALI